MGEGECDGEMMLGFAAARLGVVCWTGTLVAMAGEPVGPFIEPKLMFGLEDCVWGPPLGIWPVVPEALMITEGFLPWSPFCMLAGLEEVDDCGALAFSLLAFCDCWAVLLAILAYESCACTAFCCVDWAAGAAWGWFCAAFEVSLVIRLAELTIQSVM
jgi:hypothetical protein